MFHVLIRFKVISLLLLPAWVFGQAADATNFEQEIRPVLRKLCVSCHGPDKQEADLRFDTLDPDLINGGGVDTWHDALDQINLGEMPPSKAEVQPTANERLALTRWLNESLKAAAESKRNAGGRIHSRRLTRYEYANTMRDLLGIEFDFARELPPEPASKSGFLNDGFTLEMSGTQIETYLSTARRALGIAIVEGEEPKVFRVDAKETAVGKLPRKKDGGAIPVNPEFILDIPEFPRSGEFEIVVRAGAVIPEGHDVPRMRVSLGCVPGIIHVPRKLIGEVDVTAPPDHPETFVFRGRMEDYPQSGDREFGANVSFNGVIVLIDFLDADGKELRYPHRHYSDPPAKPNKKGDAVAKPPSAPPGPLLDIVIDSVRFEAPIVSGWPPQSHVSLLGTSDASDEVVRARVSLERFMSRAFRRPVSSSEVDRMMPLFEQIRSRVGSYEKAMRETLACVLVSPHFLYLVDTHDDFAIANQLSYFLWSTMPDRRLLDLASDGKLREPEVLANQTNRLIDDPRAIEFVNHFADQWFDLGGLDRIAVNPEFFPDFDNDLKGAMTTETRAFLGEILHRDLSCLELIDSDWTMANRALANHYGLTNRPRDGSFQRVALTDADRRGGILGQAAFLLSNSNGEASHPIKRAVWILDRLLDSPPAPPPPDVPELDSARPDLARLTFKQQLEAHRKNEACNQCHRNIDPWGIALENYDATGRFRTEPPLRSGKQTPAGSGLKLDPVTTLPDGAILRGADDLKRYLLETRRRHFARTIVKRLSTYALGRSLDLGDRETIERLTDEFIANDFRLRSLIVSLVTSDLFLRPPVES